MKTIGLNEDYELRGIKRSDDSSDDSDASQNRRHSPASANEHPKDKDIGSDTSANSQRQRKAGKGIKKVNRKLISNFHFNNFDFIDEFLRSTCPWK